MGRAARIGSKWSKLFMGVPGVIGAGGDTPWYLAGGISAADCIAAYTPKGAASLAASLVNQANGATYALTQVGAQAVTWAADTGWAFANNSGLSMGTITLPATFTIFVRFANYDGTDTGFIFGAVVGAYKFGVQKYNTTGSDGRLYARRGDASTILSTSYLGAGTFAYTSQNFYTNAAQRNSSAFTVTLQEFALWIGGDSGGVEWWTGNIEYFAVYGAELTEGQIQALHAATGSDIGGAVVMFDDAVASVYAEAFAYMQPLGIVATTYVISSNVGTEGYATWDQLREMAAAGWTIANHTDTHVELSSESAETVATRVGNCRDALVAQSLAAGATHVAYPYGGTVSADMLTGMAAASMTTGRSTVSGSPNLATTPFYEIPVDTYLKAVTALATAQSGINTARLGATWRMVLLHGILETPGVYDWSVANFQALMDWIAAGDIPCITITDLYDRMVAARA